MATKRMALGKGLGALIPEIEPGDSKTLFYCGIEEVIPNRSQPRKHFDEAKLQELADSIREKGILEPLIVRKIDQGYELIVGERRWRAAQRAGLREVPVIVKEVSEQEVLEISLIENIQRDDLNPIEEAEAYNRLAEEFNLSQADLAEKIGKDRTTVANTLRLLKLPSEIRDHLIQGHITSGHARAILSLESEDKQEELCALIIKKGLSVREVEVLSKRWAGKHRKGAALSSKRSDLESQFNALQDSLRKRLGTKVLILQKGKRGKIEIEYYSSEDLERIVETLLGESDGA
jgi:ParB family chromosome partitioning protein